MNEQHVLDFYLLGSAFAGVTLIIVVALALARTTLRRVAFWLAVIAEVCLLAGAISFTIVLWRVFPAGPGSEWWFATSYALVAAGVVTGVVALVLLMRELALRGASGWMLLCAVALLVLVGAESSFFGYTLVQIFDFSFAYRLLHSVSEQREYYGVVSLLLVCAPLAPLVYSVRSARSHRAPVSAA